MKKKLALIICAVVVIALGTFLTWWFLLRKVEVTLEYGKKEKIILVQINKKLDKSDIKIDLGENFIGWFKVIDEKYDSEILDKKEFNFNEKITKNIKLVAVYSSNESITVKFETNGGTKIEDLVMKKGAELKLPKNPTKKGYTFDGWKDEDKSVVKDGALLTEDLTLYASWKKEEKKTTKKSKETSKKSTETTNTTKKSTTNTKKSENEAVSYKCDAGYTLSGTKCIKKTLAKATCPEGTFSYNLTRCVKISYSDRVDSNKTCPTKTVNVGGGHTQSFQGKLDKLGTHYCFYGVVTASDENNRTTCTNRGHKWNSNDGKCYYDMDQNYTSTCNSGYAHIVDPNSYKDIHGLNSGCYPLKTKNPTCPRGYKLVRDDKRRNICQIEKDATKVN